MRILLFMCLCWLVLTTPLYAQEPTPALKYAQSVGLVTEIEASQIVDEVGITLHWVYADVNQIALSYTIEGIEPSSDTFYMPQPNLMDINDNIFSSSSGGSEEVQRDDGLIDVLITNTFYTQVLRHDDIQVDNDYFLNEYGENLPDEIPFQLDITLQKVMPNMMPVEGEPIRTYQFEFATPLHHAMTQVINATETVNDIHVTLQEITVTPTVTALQVCYDLPDQQDWQPEASVMIDDKAGLPMSIGMVGLPTADEVERCFNLEFDAFYDGEPATLTFTLEKIWTSEPSETLSFWDDVHAELLKQDIDVEFIVDGGVQQNIISKPDGMTDDEVWLAIMEVRESLRDAVVGPWVFNINLP